MKYAEFIAHARGQQRDYIRQEKRRYAKAAKLAARYQGNMLRLGLHPLTRLEIADRQQELERMAARLEIDMGDSPAMCAAFEMHHGTTAAA